jgi:crotonobetainyl-CoA:carnitine CoA-transferase CaiB-like acyl-CoA transferase
VAEALGRGDELIVRGWRNHADTQGHDVEIRELMQSWASEFDSVADFERALDSARIPLGTVKSLGATADEPWALARGAFVEIDVNGATARIPRSPFRFSEAEVGPAAGAYARGAHNRMALQELLGMSAAEIDALQAAGVLVSE